MINYTARVLLNGNKCGFTWAQKKTRLQSFLLKYTAIVLWQGMLFNMDREVGKARAMYFIH